MKWQKYVDKNQRMNEYIGKDMICETIEKKIGEDVVIAASSTICNE